MSQKVKAIVIHAGDKKDKDASVLLFSLEEGKIWATLKGVKNPKSKLRAAKELFSFGDFVLEDGKAGKIVTGFDRIENFHEISADMDKFCEGCALLEVLSKLEFSSDVERAQVFVLALNALKVICFKNVENLYVLDKFLIEIFRIFGFPLYSDRCTCCKSRTFDHLYVNYAIGELVCVACKNLVCEELSNVTYSALRILTNTDLERLASLKLARESGLSLLKILTRNFEVRFDTNLKFVGILE